MSLDLSEFHAAFFEEVAEHLTGLEDGLLQLESRPEDAELINAIFRAAHSIKGTGSALGFTEVAGFTHHVETVLDQMHQRQLAITHERIEILLRSTDALCSLIDSAKDNSPAPADLDAIIVALKKQLAPGPDEQPSSEALTGVVLFGEDEPAAPESPPRKLWRGLRRAPVRALIASRFGSRSLRSKS